MRFKLLFLLSTINFAVTANFLINDDVTLSNTTVSFNIGEYSIEEKGDYKEILTTSKGRLDRYGEPDLPQFSFNYAVDNTKSYNVDYDVLEYDVISNIELYPAQKRNIDNKILKNNDLYFSNVVYPNQNLEYSIQSLRGYEMLSISFVPFEYNLESKELKVYRNVVFNIIETDEIRVSNNVSK